MLTGDSLIFCRSTRSIERQLRQPIVDIDDLTACPIKLLDDDTTDCFFAIWGQNKPPFSMLNFFSIDTGITGSILHLGNDLGGLTSYNNGDGTLRFENPTPSRRKAYYKNAYWGKVYFGD
jgi:hypothetical protein